MAKRRTQVQAQTETKEVKDLINPTVEEIKDKVDLSDTTVNLEEVKNKTSIEETKKVKEVKEVKKIKETKKVKEVKEVKRPRKVKRADKVVAPVEKTAKLVDTYSFDIAVDSFIGERNKKPVDERIHVIDQLI